MLGWRTGYDNGLDPVQQDAKKIAAIRDRGAPVPESLKNANEQEIGEYLRRNSVLRIPDDHVESVQIALESRVRDFPENYFLGPNPSNEQLRSVLDRVKGTGLNSAQTLDQLVENNPSADEVAQDRTQNVTDAIPLDSTQSIH